MIRQEEVFRIGKIGKPHGVKGEVSLMFEDDVFDRVDADYLVLLVDGILVPFFFEEYRFKSDETALVKFATLTPKSRLRNLPAVKFISAGNWPENLQTPCRSTKPKTSVWWT